MYKSTCLSWNYFRILGGKDKIPVRNAFIYIGDERVAKSNRNGEFDFRIDLPETEKVTIRVRDIFRRFATTIRVSRILSNSGFYSEYVNII